MYVVSTAGHVDHGKTALIERLTGIDPDRLAEEKARGLTIDLGFAWLTLPSGREIGIVDVPGHERFVHNMLAGVGSVDATIFVVAANEGWKPQSEEHLAILDLLGARGGVVALTKRDLATPLELRAIGDQVRGRLEGTALAGAEILPVSSPTGEGIEDLLAAIERMLDRTPQAEDRERPRLFVDRSFSVRGAGTVVTGTLTGGRLTLDQEVEILPSGARARVRGIQTHKRTREEATPGSRVALNLAGLERTEIVRGDAVVLPGQWRPTTRLDVRLRAVRSLHHPLTDRGAYRVHVGSAEVGARLALLDLATLGAGEEAFVRLSLAEPVVAAPFDRVVVRDVGRRETVAGGEILDAHSEARVPRARRPAQLRERAAAGRAGLASRVITERGAVARADMPWLAGTAAPPADAVALGSYLLSRERFDELTGAIERTLGAFHAREPLARGMPREEARIAAGIDDQRLFAELLDVLTDRLAHEGPLLRLTGHRVTLSPEQDAARTALFGRLSDAGFSPPPLAELEGAHGAKLVRALVESGDLVKVASGIAFSRERIDEAKNLLAEAIRREGPLTASRVREILGTTRKYVIPLLEHLDATGFTRRKGDIRELAGA